MFHNEAHNFNKVPTLKELKTLSNGVASGEKEAFDKTLNFLMLNYTSSATSEDLAVIAGKYSLINPKYFLTEISKWHQKSEIGEKFGCVGITSLGENYTDMIEQQIIILNQRKSSLESVYDDTLSYIKELCLNEIEQTVNILQSAVKELTRKSTPTAQTQGLSKQAPR